MVQPALVTEKLIIGKDQWHQLASTHNLANEDAVSSFLVNQRRPFNWISGKTLHSYWNKGKAKDTKLNVLLTFLDIPFTDWDDWKSGVGNVAQPLRSVKLTRKGINHELIRNYFLGSYYLYYQKSDNSRNLVKAPFTIETDSRGQIFAKTVTEGHPYRSTLIELRDGILYIHCENEVFDEKENHIFNVGNETNPEVLFGISNTISVKTKMAIGIRNVLVKQKNAFTETTFIEKEIPFDTEGRLSKEESIVLKYFLRQPQNLINAQHCCPLSVLEIQISS
jgi:hypothetical protein